MTVLEGLMTLFGLHEINEEKARILAVNCLQYLNGRDALKDEFVKQFPRILAQRKER